MPTSPGRLSRHLKPSLAAAACLSLTLVAACGSGGSTTSSSSTDLTVVHSNQIATLDPVQAVQADTDTIASLIYDPLMTYDASNNLVGVMASKFATEPGAKAIDITLRSGMTFHDGSPVTADDVKYTFERDLAVNSGVSSYLAGYVSTTINSPTSLTIHLSAPNAFFMRQLSKVYILNSKLVTAHEGSDHGQGWLADHDAGSGPYELSGSGPLSSVTVKRWSKYYDFDPTRPTSIDDKEVDQSSTEAADLKSGTADIALKLSSADAKAVDGQDGVKTAWINSGLTEFMWMNPNTGATANPVVREALQDAYDYSGGLKAVWDGKGNVMSGILPATMPCRPTLPTYGQDLTKAKALFKQAGVTTLTMRYQPALAQFTQEATLFQSNLKSIGVDLKLVPITFSDYLTSLSNQKTIPQLMLMGDVPRFPDTGIYLNYVYNSAAVGTSYTGLSDPAVDALLNKAKVTADDTSRCQLEQQAQTLINSKHLSVYMYTYQQPVSYRSGITGIVADPNANPINLRTVRVAK
ncbi:MAG TPA: ABC transporter substrate-binding protein [Marmoricola sp.]|jgi:peptide/nickel transport system substrate-binding protein|nr:ABC transporter substrate-binding protein [Marmoricola sp.]